jgi:hypothetical protein
MKLSLRLWFHDPVDQQARKLGAGPKPWTDWGSQ